MCASECFPRSRITSTTVPPNMPATNTRAIVPVNASLITTEAVPNSTRTYVPRNSAVHSFLQFARN
jgi:hypothetical protein